MRTASSLSAIAFLWLLPSQGMAELAKWDQDRVTKLAGELAKATTDLQTALRNEPTPTLGSGQSRSYYRLVQTVRRMRTEARHLAAELASGEGYEQTLPIYESLNVMANDAREEARRTFTSNFVLDKASAVGSVLMRIAPYYDPKALTRPVDESGS